MTSKRSQHELKRIVEEAVAIVCDLPRPGLWFAIDQLEVHGRPPSRIRLWYTLHFLRHGSPFCCGEPGCQLGGGPDWLADIGHRVRVAMNLRQAVHIEIAGANANYHYGAMFRQGARLRRLRERRYP
jgi:hypothetical protein